MITPVSLPLMRPIRLLAHSHMLVFGRDIARPCPSSNEDVHPRPVDGFTRSTFRFPRSPSFSPSDQDWSSLARPNLQLPVLCKSHVPNYRQAIYR